MNKHFLVTVFLFALLRAFSACVYSEQTQKSKNQNTDMSESEIKLPKPIDDFVEAVNKGDEEKFLSFFDKEEGAVNDWGRKFIGHEAIKQWSDKEFIGAKGRLTPTKVEKNGNEISLWAGWKSNFYTGDSKFIFVVDGDKIKEMRIAGE